MWWNKGGSAVKSLLDFFRQYRKGCVLFLLFICIFGVSFFLYGVPWQVVAYPAAVCIVVGGLYLFVQYRREKKKIKMIYGLTKAFISK